MHGHGTSPRQPASATQDLDFIFAHQKGNALGQAFSHLPTPGNHTTEVEPQVVAVEAKVSAMLHKVIDFGVTQQRFGWDTPPI